ncbi:MAG: TspO/MBR family protein [Haloarculaceae archaeon]
MTAEDIEGWYADLERPEQTPPGRVFPLVWTALYSLMGLALHLVWRERDSVAGKRALGVFLIQYGLNVAWSFVFFGARSALGGLLVVALLFSVAATVVAFALVRPRAALLLVPYLTWVAFATRLNHDVWRLNR